MTHRQIGDDRTTKITASFPQNLFQTEAVIGVIASSIVAITESTEAKTCQTLQHPGETPMGEHAIKTVWSFAHVFNHQDGAMQIGEVPTAQEVRCHRQIRGDQWTVHRPA